MSRLGLSHREEAAEPLSVEENAKTELFTVSHIEQQVAERRINHAKIELGDAVHLSEAHDLTLFLFSSRQSSVNLGNITT